MVDRHHDIRLTQYHMTFECSLEQFWGLVTGRARNFVSRVVRDDVLAEVTWAEIAMIQ